MKLKIYSVKEHSNSVRIRIPKKARALINGDEVVVTDSGTEITIRNASIDDTNTRRVSVNNILTYSSENMSSYIGDCIAEIKDESLIVRRNKK